MMTSGPNFGNPVNPVEFEVFVNTNVTVVPLYQASGKETLPMSPDGAIQNRIKFSITGIRQPVTNQLNYHCWYSNNPQRPRRNALLAQQQFLIQFPQHSQSQLQQQNYGNENEDPVEFEIFVNTNVTVMPLYQASGQETLPMSPDEAIQNQIEFSITRIREPVTTQLNYHYRYSNNPQRLRGNAWPAQQQFLIQFPQHSQPQPQQPQPQQQQQQNYENEDDQRLQRNRNRKK
ncbi:MAG: hypothetical protein JSS07_01640 [Proteobacteria bacterium]|nr:hypothetical protein [Pseudomonadota bacterium]